ncbi:MAG TPA: helicase-associated domain-containing protein [Actinoplanes sp.]|nr:helicase-associated domain-containing protein [Actinoplanes sp.]
MSTIAALAAHLRTLTAEQLAGLVTNRRDVTVGPAAKTVEELAARLLRPESMAGACTLLTLPRMQVGEAAAVFGDDCSLARLAGLFGVPENDRELADALQGLIGLALVWPQDGGLAAAHLGQIWAHPLGLGAGAVELLGTQNLTQLRKLAGRHGVPTAGKDKAGLVAALTGWLARPENVRGLLDEAPPGVRRQLTDLAKEPEVLYGSPGMVLPWAVERGLLIRTMLSVNAMPREVALALRGDFTAPFQPQPPALTLTTADPAAVEQEAAAAATETLAAVTAVVEAMSAGPVPLLRTGGLGVRELRRIAKTSGQDEDRTRLTVELLAAGGLTEVSGSGLTPSTVVDDFTGADPADQLLDVIEDWMTMPASPLAPPDPHGPPARVLYWAEEEELILTGLRALTIRTLLDVVPEGRSAEPGSLAARLRWEGPVLCDQAGEDLERYVTGIWREAHRLGLLAHGSVTRIGRTMADSDGDAARERAAAMLPSPRDTVVLQNDLTAVVTGTPSAALLTLLDTVATPESRSGAWTWRFSPASIRAALDAGRGPDELITAITAVAAGARVPQTLTYLIEDVARRHGRVRVLPAGCCLCSDDETLLTEILHSRQLRALSLTRVAPTVLVSAKLPAETLAAVRAAGYAPASVRADGSPVVEVPQRRRAAPPPPADRAEMFPELELELGDPEALARDLLGG